MAAKFEMVRYGNYVYGDIPTRLSEVACNFDTKGLNVKQEYSLHTEYAYGPRRFENPVFTDYPILSQEVLDGIPLLWKNTEWSISFFEYIAAMVNNNRPPDVVEIHPPFKDYCSNFHDFMEVFLPFEDLIKNKYSNSLTVIENRVGTLYPGNFLLENKNDIVDLLQLISKSQSSLKLVLDIPQFLSTFGNKYRMDINEIIQSFEYFSEYKHLINGVHIWGRRGRAHIGDLNSLFFDDPELKTNFLRFLSSFFDDGITRLLVPEINGTPQTIFDNILEDLKKFLEFI